MTGGIRCFAGANTRNGFYSCFDGIFMNRARVFYIKGAPGVGKNSLMKRVLRRQEACGHAVSAFYCSSDPDSLDGVVDETLSCAFLDATAPHAYDPAVPGARDTLISLGDYLNEAELSADAASIMRIQKEIGREFASAAHFLGAAGHAEAAAEGVQDARRAALILRELLSLLPNTHANGGTVRRYFLSAHTCQGYVSFEKQFPADETVSVPIPFGGNMDGILRTVAEKAAEKGLAPILFLSPICPEQARQVYIPEIPLLVTASDVPARRVLEGLYREGCGEDGVYAAACLRAHEHLRRAKTLHDELEGYYIPRMDFSRLVEVESRIYAQLDALEAGASV